MNQKEISIEYKINKKLTVEQFMDLLKRSTLGERRPMDDKNCLEGMLSNSNLLVTAWDGDDNLIGVARSVTDFHFACYLSDLAVCQKYQCKGIGKQLQILTQKQLKGSCQLILLAAPAAKHYYKHLGYTHNERCWVLEPGSCIGSGNPP